MSPSASGSNGGFAFGVLTRQFGGVQVIPCSSVSGRSWIFSGTPPCGAAWSENRKSPPIAIFRSMKRLLPEDTSGGRLREPGDHVRAALDVALDLDDVVALRIFQQVAEGV